MQHIKHIPPENMKPAERIAEVAGLLSNGLIRLRAKHAEISKTDPRYREVQLGFCLEKSVHTNDVIQL
jgi:hypothetical protein